MRTRGRSKGKASDIRVIWGNKAPATGDILILASFFFTCREVRYVWPAVARGVLDHVLPGEFGVLDLMLSEPSREPLDEAAALQLVEGGDENGHRAWQEG